MGGESPSQRSATPWFLVVPPDARREWIKREHLNSRLDREIATRAMVIVEAPSGYGKTVALAGWANTRVAPTAWLTATAHDTQPAQLLSGVLTALKRVHPDNAALTALIRQHYDGDLPTAPAMLALVETILDAVPDTVLIVDDAHLSSADAFTEVILPLARFGRGRLRFVTAATRNVRSWCAHLLAHGEASLIDPFSLAFTLDEVAEVQSCAGREVAAPATVDRIWEDTQGWPVAVLLALQNGNSNGIEPTAQYEVMSRYVETVVLDGLRSDLREFVVAATTCNRLTAELAVQLSGRSDAPELLEECRRIGLFLDRFHQDASETVYQWHSTFARHCREIQSHRDSGGYRQRHRIAADWLSTRFPEEAVLHALEAHEPELSLAIIEDNWLQMITGGKASVLAAACVRIPAPWNNEPTLLLIRACCLDLAGDRAGAEMLVDEGRAMLDGADAEGQERSLATAAFADLFLLHDQVGLQAAAERAYNILSSNALTVGQYLHGRYLVGWTEMRLRRNPSRAIKLLSGVMTGASGVGYTVLAGRAAANLSFALAFGGRFAEAEAALGTLTSADAPGEWEYYDGGIEVMSAIFIAYWRNDLEAVLELARELHAHGGHSGSYAALGRVYFAFAAAGLRAPSLYSEATDMLLGVSSVEMHGVPWPVYRSIGSAQLAIARSDHAAALEALQRVTDWKTIPMTLVLAAELCRRLGQRERAIEILRNISRSEMVSYIYASAQFTKAAIAWAAQDRAVAHQALERSLRAAVPEGIIAPYAELDDVGRELLTHHAAWGTSFEGFIAARLVSGKVGISRNDVISAPLSAREREVFSYLGTTMTAEEIATELHVSVNTVRSHQRSIYRKLGVSTRREAVRVRL